MAEPAIYLQRGASTRLKQILNCTSHSKVAETIGIDQGQYSRIASGDYRPGLKFMARALYVTRGRATFEDLFEVVDENTRPQALRPAS